MRPRNPALIGICLLLAACSYPVAPAASPTPPPTAPSPTVLRTAPPATSPPAPPNPSYTLDTTFDFDRHYLSVNETIRYPNHTGVSLDRLTLSIAANLWPDCFQLEGMTVDGRLVDDFSLDGHRLDVPLPEPLEPGSVSELQLRYHLALPYLDQAHSLRARIFGYGEVQTNLTNWYAFIVPFIDGEWVIHEPWSHGEYLVYPLADFVVDLCFVNPGNAPLVAASGAPEPHGDCTRYTLTAGRSFALSFSRDFEVASLKVGEVRVSSYYFPIYQRAGEGALIASKQAIEVFSRRFGPYPHKTLSIVVADFMDSMEFSALYFHSRYFYDQYDGSLQNYLTTIAVHETAHQWWFETVANDQAQEPWLDESLATYSEALFYETRYPDLVPWWWSYRIDFHKPAGYIDISVYQGQNDETYKRTVYFNGAHFLQDLRERVGDEVFFATLRDYYTRHSGEIATGDDFFATLNAHTNVEYADIVRTYFRTR